MATIKAVVLLSTLAFATAEILLAPEDVPMECAPICGPIVELTRKCSLGSTVIEFEEETFARVKRRRVEARGRGHNHSHVHDKERRKRAVVTNAFGQVVPVPSGLGGGQTFTVTTVVTLTADPGPSSTLDDEAVVTTPPPEGTASPTTSVMTTTMTMVVPDEDESSTDETLELPTDDTLVPSSTPLVVENGADNGGEYEHAETEEAEDVIGEAERQCVCQNNSFDVEEISGLCSSCIWQAGYMRGSEYAPQPLHLVRLILERILGCANRSSHAKRHEPVQVFGRGIHPQQRLRGQRHPSRCGAAHATRGCGRKPR